MRSNKSLFVLVAILAITAFYSKAQIQIISGFEKGSYYQMAMDIKSVAGDMVTFDTIYSKTWDEKDSIYLKKTAVPMIEVLTSPGAQQNFNRVSKSTTALSGFMQYDVLVTQQLKELNKYAKRTDSIMLLLPLGVEEIHLITLKTSKIKGLSDLKGKKVAIGSAGQGTAVTAKFIKEKTGIEWIDFDLSIKDAFPALLNGNIDAFFFVGSAPVLSLNGLSPTFEQLKLIPVNHPKLTEYYVPSTIATGTYHWLKADVQTLGVKLILVSNLSTETAKDKETIKRMLNAIKNNISKLQEKGHPNWKKVDFNFSEVKWEVHPISKSVFNIP